MDNVSTRLGEAETRITLIEERELESIAHKKYISELENQLNSQCQELLRNELEIAGSPEETHENLHHTVLVAARKLGVDLSDGDIDHITRVGSHPAEKEHVYHRHVVVKFLRRNKRNELLKASKTRRSLTTEALELPGPSTRVFFNERLTRNSRMLFRETRKKCKQLNYRHCWTYNGTIYVRKREGGPALPIKSQMDFDRVFPDACNL